MEPTESESEFFPTPVWAIERMAEAVVLPGRPGMPARCLDPCVGLGVIPRVLASPYRHWTRVDIRDTGYADHVGSYLEAELRRFDLAVFNPPFSKALRFVDRAIKHCDVVIMLQKLNWLASEERAQWMRKHTPNALYVLPNRPDFDGRGGDACDYCWYVWGGQYHGIHILQCTSKETRLAQKPQYQAPLERQQRLFEP